MQASKPFPARVHERFEKDVAQERAKHPAFRRHRVNLAQ